MDLLGHEWYQARPHDYRGSPSIMENVVLKSQAEKWYT